MIPVSEDRRPPLTPQLALRVAILGSFALAMFAIIFFRLWFLQVLDTRAYRQQASVNQVRDIEVPAPRGQILDSSGNVLVSNTQALDVQITPPNLPVKLTSANVLSQPEVDLRVYRRLAHVLGISAAPTRCPVTVIENGRPVKHVLHIAQIPCAVAQQLEITPYANVTVKTNVPTAVQYYIAERQDRFPGVQVQQQYERRYPLNDLAAQLFGTIGPLSCDAYALHARPNANNCELKDPRYKGVPQTDVVGQSGLEWYYNQYLQGRDGAEHVQVNALGQFSRYLSVRSPQAGYSLKTSLDINLQRAGQQALAQSIASNPPAPAGSFVAMNPETGEIYALGSLPTFDPNVFTKPISYSQYNQLFGANADYPLLNRATQSAGPTGSTFKGITSTAALESGAWSLGETFDDTGQFCFSGQCRHNAGGAVDGTLDIVNALRVSSDDFFYNLGVATNADPIAHPNGGALQYWARKYGIGQPTGVDTGYEVPGTLPTPAWRQQRNRLEAECDNATGPFAGKPKHPPGGCGIADGTNRPWSVGDNENLAVGQGDVQVTPLQLAVAYSAIANGGTIVRPHIADAIESAKGTVVQRIDPPPVRHLTINPAYLSAIREGLHEAAQTAGGTSDDVFGNFPEQVYGKTGTAQYNGQADYAWYVCFVPNWATNKPILVVVHVEQGGFGAVGAAPVARQILSQWFFGNRGQYIAGSSHTL
jgi:penicillin-binding protein 2